MIPGGHVCGVFGGRSGSSAWLLVRRYVLFRGFFFVLLPSVLAGSAVGQTSSFVPAPEADFTGGPTPPPGQPSAGAGLSPFVLPEPKGGAEALLGTSPADPSALPPGPDCGGFFRLPEERFLGPGGPLIQESWNYRPLSVSGFVGFAQGGTLIDDWIRQDQGVMTGLRLGWDFAYYWGCETRLAFAGIAVADSQRAMAAQQAADDAAGVAPDDPYRRRFDGRRDNDLTFWDISLLYYPWGDSRYRPYFFAGMGVVSFEFTDRLSTTWNDTVFGLPLGFGIKYRQNDCVAFRLEVADNMAFPGAGLETMHNISVTGGAEIRFGGSRRAYWPWNPGRHYW
jgi:hypothetical protein